MSKISGDWGQNPDKPSIYKGLRCPHYEKSSGDKWGQKGEHMTKEEKRQVILKTLDRVKKVVETHNEPYSDNKWDKYIEVVSNTMKSSNENHFQKLIYHLMSDTLEYCDKYLADDQEEN